MRLLATPRFLKSIPPERRADVLAGMRAAQVAFGQPHLHAGVGLRRIPPFMECRCGLDLRLVFQRERLDLVFHFCGSHDAVARFLKHQR